MDDLNLMSINAANTGATRDTDGQDRMITDRLSRSRGKRPAFVMVTGVSTGALIAPLAFPGLGRDPMLQSVHALMTSDGTFLPRLFHLLPGAGSLTDSQSLQDRIERVSTLSMIEDIAAARRRGRLLQIGITDLDAQGRVIWDIGRIGASGQPDKGALTVNALISNYFLPGAFATAPVNEVIDVKPCQQLNVDGGVRRETFVCPAHAVMARPRGPRRMWWMRNSKISPECVAIRCSAFSIASRSVGTLIEPQASGDLAALRSLSRPDGFDSCLTAVPPTFSLSSNKPFDPRYMSRFFAMWERSGPPGGAGPPIRCRYRRP